MASVGGDVAGDDRNDFGVDARGRAHTKATTDEKGRARDIVVVTQVLTMQPTLNPRDVFDWRTSFGLEYACHPGSASRGGR